ncbi:hypothetical protein [Nocardiopsis sp. CNT-189]|uniref:hypothetical protein n=1 Tax=Nocardiopsis oceanisediminis TaxID=2816862 RepID=UPI003B3B27F1
MAAIARAVHFGARVPILDEPAAGLGVKRSGAVLRCVRAARDAGPGAVFITPDPHHAHLAGDRFTVPRLGEVEPDAPRTGPALDDLVQHKAGGAEPDALKHDPAR